MATSTRSPRPLTFAGSRVSLPGAAALGPRRQIRERYRILHLLLESVIYDGATGELELAFHPLGITSLATEAGMVGQPAAEAA